MKNALKSIWRFIWISTLSIIFLSAIAVGVLYWKYKPVINSTPTVSETKLSVSSIPHKVIKANNGTILWQNSSIQSKSTSEQEVAKPLVLKNALLSIEDRDFYQESGVNYYGIIRAGVNDVLHRNNLQGGSTLTQQLVKLSYYSTNAADRTIDRKLQEIILANNVNAQYNKNQILSMYMNKVYMGQGVYGMGTAAKYYMNKSINKLSIPQAALLAGLVQSPSVYDPYVQPKAATWRRNLVLHAMYENHKINHNQLNAALQTPINKTIVPFKSHVSTVKSVEQRTLIADNYLQSVKAQLKKTNWGWNNQQQSQTVTTNLDWTLQQWLVNAVKRNHGMALPNKELQLGVTVMNNHNGQVVAQVGNRTFNQFDGYNRATQMSRSTGSVIKPILDYGPAFDQLHWGSNRTIYDSKYYYPHTDIQVHDWDDKHMGRLTAKQALYLSRNIPAIKVFTSVGINQLKPYAKAIGINSNLTDANAIGVNASTEQMASAFSALAQNGVQVKPRYLKSVETLGQSINYPIEKQALFSKQTAFMLTDSLLNVPTKGQSGYAAEINGFAQAGKTGTIGYASNAHMPAGAISDGWYVGYTKDYTIAVWTGYDNPYQRKHVLKDSDNKISETIYKTIMLQLRSYKMVHNDKWSEPSGLQKMMDNSFSWKTDHPQYAAKHIQ